MIVKVVDIIPDGEGVEKRPYRCGKKFTPRGGTKRIMGYCVKYVDDNKIE